MARKRLSDHYAAFAGIASADDLRVLGIDTSLFDSQRDNITALVQANRLAYDKFQAIGARQIELLLQTRDELVVAALDAADPGPIDEKMARQVEFARTAVERTLDSMRELAEQLAEVNTEAFDLLNKRFEENLAELKKALEGHQ